MTPRPAKKPVTVLTVRVGRELREQLEEFNVKQVAEIGENLTLGATARILLRKGLEAMQGKKEPEC